MIRALQMRVNTRTERYSQADRGRAGRARPSWSRPCGGWPSGRSGFTGSPGTWNWGRTNERPCMHDPLVAALLAVGRELAVCGLPGVLSCGWLVAAACRPAAPSRAKPAWQPPAAEQVRAGRRLARPGESRREPCAPRPPRSGPNRPATADGDDLLGRMAAPWPWPTPTPASWSNCARSRMHRPRCAAQAWLADPKTPPLWPTTCACSTAAGWPRSLFDEALEQLAGLSRPRWSIRPRCCSTRRVVYHRLLEPGRRAGGARQLLRGRRAVPAALRGRGPADGGRPEAASRRTRSTTSPGAWTTSARRLDLGRGGPKVRKVEDGVIKSLDKLIKELEDQQQQQRRPAAASGIQPSRPAAGQRILRRQGPGEVAKQEHRQQERLGQPPAQGARRGHAADRPRLPRPLPRHHRAVFPQTGQRRGSR